MAPGVMGLAIWSAVINFALVPVGLLLGYFINVYHDGTENNFAFVLTLFQAGMIVGSLITTIRKKWENPLRVIMVTGIILNVGNIIMAIAPYQYFWIIGIGRLLFGLNIMIDYFLLIN